MAAINILIENSNNLKLSGHGRRELMILFKLGVDKMIDDLKKNLREYYSNPLCDCSSEK
jgi:hypothetical protein